MLFIHVINAFYVLSMYLTFFSPVISNTMPNTPTNLNKSLILKFHSGIKNQKFLHLRLKAFYPKEFSFIFLQHKAKIEAEDLHQCREDLPSKSAIKIKVFTWTLASYTSEKYPFILVTQIFTKLSLI